MLYISVLWTVIRHKIQEFLKTKVKEEILKISKCIVTLCFKVLCCMPVDGPHDRNMYHIATKVIKFVVVDGSVYVDFDVQGIHKRMVRFQKLTRNLFLTLHGQNVHRQQRQLSKFLMRYQQFASHAYCGASFEDGVAAGKDSLCAPF